MDYCGVVLSDRSTHRLGSFSRAKFRLCWKVAQGVRSVLGYAQCQAEAKYLNSKGTGLVGAMPNFGQQTLLVKNRRAVSDGLDRYLPISSKKSVERKLPYKYYSVIHPQLPQLPHLPHAGFPAIISI